MIAFLLGPIGRYLLIAAAVGGAFLYGRQHYIDVGYQKAIHAIAAQDAAAVKEAKHAESTVADCFAGGGTWDIANILCIPANTGKR